MNFSKKSKKIWLFAIAILIITTIATGIFLPRIIENKIADRIEKFNDSTKTVSISSIEFLNINSLKIDSIKINYKDFSSTTIYNLRLKIKPQAIIFGGKYLSKIEIEEIETYFDWQTFRREKSEKKSSHKQNLQTHKTPHNKLFSQIPNSISIEKMILKSRIKNDNFQIELSNFTKSKNSIFTQAQTIVNTDTNRISINGEIIDKELSLSIRPEIGKIKMPTTELFGDIFCTTDSANFACQITTDETNNAKIRTSIYNTSIAHFRLSDDTVNIRYLDFDILTHATRNSIEIDSSSSITINDFCIKPSLYILRDTATFVRSTIEIPQTQAQTFINSLPESLFKNLSELQLSGNFEAKIDLECNSKMLDSLRFSFDLKTDKINIEKMGKTDLQKLSHDCEIYFYEDNRIVKCCQISDSATDYLPLDSISDYLQWAVLQAEDGIFFQHRGFISESFRYALIQNLKNGRFVRGGSTITMQLVKNAFLNQNKTITRKLEESIIVWLIENLQLTSKQRMFEVYMNIIEWAPNIYGAKQAARFYFDKPASQLTLSESIYLASLVPRPKKFKYTFKNGKLRDYYENYYHTISNNMVLSHRIEASDTIGLRPIEKLNGEAAKFIQPADSTIANIFEDDYEE